MRVRKRGLEQERQSLVRKIKYGMLGKCWFDYCEQEAWIKEGKRVLQETEIHEPAESGVK